MILPRSRGTLTFEEGVPPQPRPRRAFIYSAEAAGQDGDSPLDSGGDVRCLKKSPIYYLNYKMINR